MSQAASRPGAAASLAMPLIATITVATACASVGTSATGALEPRFVAVHNTLAAMGLAQVGPIYQGTLAEGREARSTLELPAGCTTIVAVGETGVRDLDARLLDPQGQPLAHDTTQEPQAVLKACPEAAGSYVLVVKAASGSGAWVAAAWQGAGAPPSASAVAQGAARQALGTCEAPIPLSPGTVNGSTARGEDANTGSCERSDARELVYELDVTQRERVSIDVEAHFDSILYIRKDACADADAEVDCNDDAPSSGRNHSRIERVLEPGKYFIFVDGYNQESGAFKLTLSTSDVVSLGEVCAQAPLLLAGAPQSATTHGDADNAEASCGGGAEGADAAWRLELAARSRVRLAMHSDEASPVLHVRTGLRRRAERDGLRRVRARGRRRDRDGDLRRGPLRRVRRCARSRRVGQLLAARSSRRRPRAGASPGDGCGDAPAARQLGRRDGRHVRRPGRRCRLVPAAPARPMSSTTSMSRVVRAWSRSSTARRAHTCSSPVGTAATGRRRSPAGRHRRGARAGHLLHCRRRHVARRARPLPAPRTRPGPVRQAPACASAPVSSRDGPSTSSAARRRPLRLVVQRGGRLQRRPARTGCFRLSIRVEVHGEAGPGGPGVRGDPGAATRMHRCRRAAHRSWPARARRRAIAAPRSSGHSMRDLLRRRRRPIGHGLGGVHARVPRRQRQVMRFSRARAVELADEVLDREPAGGVESASTVSRPVDLAQQVTRGLGELEPFQVIARDGEHRHVGGARDGCRVGRRGRTSGGRKEAGSPGGCASRSRARTPRGRTPGFTVGGGALALP